MIFVIDRIVNWLLGLAVIAITLSMCGESAYVLLRDMFVSRRKLRFTTGKKNNNLVRMLAVVSGDKSKIGNFAPLSVVLAAVVFIILVSISGSLDIWIFAVSAGVGLLPIIIQWGRLQSMRIKGSYEGLDLITAFSNSYIVSNFNAISALDMTMSALANCPYSRFNVARLSKAAKVYQTEEDLQEALEVFVYAYKTEWADILSFCIFTGIHEGTNISASLSSLIEQFKRARQVAEKNRRYNRETMILMKLLIPVAYFGLLYYGSTLFGKSFWTVMLQQFTSPMALKLFIVMFIMVVVCWVLSSIVSRPKYDL